MRANVRAISKLFTGITILSGFVASCGGALAQQNDAGGWATNSDSVAKQLIEQERKWATLSCLPNSTIAPASAAFVEHFVAADFIGTSPKGALYSKSSMTLKQASLPTREPERDCKLLGAKVRFFGPDVAVIYGNESAVVKGLDKKERTRTLVWTDTWQRQAGNWQIIAVQDMVVPSK